MKNNPQLFLKIDEYIKFPQQFTVNEHTDIPFSASSSHVVEILNKIENTNLRMDKNKISRASDSQIENSKPSKSTFRKKSQSL